MDFRHGELIRFSKIASNTSSTLNEAVYASTDDDCSVSSRFNQKVPDQIQKHLPSLKPELNIEFPKKKKDAKIVPKEAVVSYLFIQY